MDPTAYWERNDHTVHCGTGEIRLDTGNAGSKTAIFGCSGNGEAYKRDPRSGGASSGSRRRS